MNRIELTKLLQEFRLTPNPALGQNFLVEDAVLDQLMQGHPLSLGVLEIGPGLGALTERLLSAPKVIAVEIDEAMIRALSVRFSDRENLTLLHEDFLKTDLVAITARLGAPFSVAANLPYYVTTPICTRLLECPDIAVMTLMLQKEAAARFFARPGDKIYGPLSILAACRYDISRVMEVPSGCYYPAPTVESTVLRLTRRADTPFLPNLLPLLTAAFSMRRKTLHNNLKGTDYLALLESAGIDPARRAESLKPEEWMRLAQCAGAFSA